MQRPMVARVGSARINIWSNDYAALVMSDPSAAERVARLIQQGFRLIVALRAVRESDWLTSEKGG